MPSRDLLVSIETFPLANPFTISRGTKTHADVVVCEVREGAFLGRGEAVPYKHYGETLESVAAQIEKANPNLSRHELLSAMPAGAARNALDCALWDLESKIAGKRAWEIAGVAMQNLNTLYTLSLDTPANMAMRAKDCGYNDLKIKLGGKNDEARLAAIRAAVPHARLLIDANEGWTRENIHENLAACAHHGVFCIEQPLPAQDDEFLREIKSPIPLCADESLHTREGLAALKGKYSFINIKLDKTGGLTEALLLKNEAQRLGFKLMVGCMVGTSLAMAPALIIGQGAEIIDLDGPLLLKEDRANGLIYEKSTIHPFSPALWG